MRIKLIHTNDSIFFFVFVLRILIKRCNILIIKNVFRVSNVTSQQKFCIYFFFEIFYSKAFIIIGCLNSLICVNE